MKNNLFITLLIVLLTWTFSLEAQQSNPKVLQGEAAHEIAAGAELVRVKSFSEVPNYIRFAQGKTIAEEKALPYLKQFIASDAVDFKLLNSSRDKLGYEHKRYRQSINGIPLEYSAYLLHLKNGKVHSMNGNIPSHPQISGQFSITETQALNFAKNSTENAVWIFEENANHPYREEYKTPKGEKVYYPANGNLYSNTFRAAYKFDMFSIQPYERNWVYVDAETGTILNKETRIHTIDSPGTAITGYSGEQSITTDSYGGIYRLRESGRGNGIATYNCQMTNDYGSAVDFTDNDNYWDNANADLDQYATDAHFATEQTYDYFYTVHGRNSIDGNGHELNSYVHYNLTLDDYPNNMNAFWNGSVMTYGDGDAENGITPLTTVDISAHEITHGLTSYTCNLVYQDEPGAINEAFSDIFGTCVEFFAVPEFADWNIGEDIGAVFRSMDNPNDYNKPDTYLGNYWHTDASDYGGVHTNMSVLSYWFYLIAVGDNGTNDNGDSYNVTGFGMDNAADIAFRLQTVYLTNTSEFLDARFYGIQAGVDFHGACSPEVEVITDAFYAVGLGGEYVDGVLADFDASYTENCAVPFTVNFQNYSINGSSFEWDFGDGSTSTEVNPTHTYTTLGDYTVSLIAYGGTCGENSISKTDFISINPNNPCMVFMPTNGNLSSTECSGTLYDDGGPDNPYSNNSDATFTIEPPGASQISLTINEFDIEAGSGSNCDYDYIAFYDGPDASYPLINDTYYCNTTGNPESIVSTGGSITIVFHSDVGLSMNGFEIDWICMQEDAPPIADFSNTNTISCNGRIQFTDESLNLPTSWAWDFGDGNSSTEANPYHIYQSSGDYTVQLTASNDYGEDSFSKSISVNLGDAPLVENQVVCIDSVFTLSAEADSDDINWYSDENCTNLLHSGSIWEHDPIQEATSYFLREMLPGPIFSIGATNNTAGGGYFGNPDYVHYLIFDAYQPFELLSVEVNADGAGVRSIAIRDQYQNILESVDVYVPDGISRIDLNLEVPVGSNLQLVGLEAPNLFRTSDIGYLDYPYTIDEVLSIKRSSASTADPLAYYYYFYDWEIQTAECESETAQIDIDVTECTVGASELITSDIKIYPNPAKNTLYISGFPESSNEIIIELQNIEGKTLKQAVLNGNSLDISDLSTGMYVLKIQIQDEIIHQKLMIK
jgi:Zn-dependent metalloprotease